MEFFEKIVEKFSTIEAKNLGKFVPARIFRWVRGARTSQVCTLSLKLFLVIVQHTQHQVQGREAYPQPTIGVPPLGLTLAHVL